jgi:hypothetical protein
VDVRVREAWNDTTAAEIHAVGARQRILVRADTSGDPVTGNRKRRRCWQGAFESPDDAAFEDHGRNLVSAWTGTGKEAP